MREPDWVRHVVWWQVYPLGFTGADTTGVDRSRGRGLTHLVGWLDHAVALGASGIALGPVFESGTHGYDTRDPFRIDSRIGTDADFDLLVREAHDRGLRVLLDGVFNHVGREFETGPGPLEDWYVVRGTDPEERPEREVFEGHDALLRLNHASPRVRDLVADVMCHWLDRGADGWRLDAAYAVPTDFWHDVLGRVRARHPEAYVVGEVIHGDYPAIVQESGMHAVTQYELWKATWSSLNDANFFELAAALERHARYLETFVPLTFVGNHDVTRIASRLDDPQHLAHALVVLCCVGGTPTVYYGDEVGLTGVKEERVGGDDVVRPAYPDPGEAVGRADVLALHQELIGLRRRHPWLHTAVPEVVVLQNEQLVLDLQGDGQRLRVLMTIGAGLGYDTAGLDVLAGSAEVVDGQAVIGPHSWAVLG